MPVSDPFRERIADRLRSLYGPRADATLRRIDALVDRYARLRAGIRGLRLGPQTALLVAYGDQVRETGRPALEVLDGFLREYGLDRVFSAVHLLPVFPSSSDDGFSVVDYRRVDPKLGTWEDVRRLGRTFDLMLDLVLNHCSRQHAWFQGYLRGETPYADYFIEVDPRADLSAVARPRSGPLVRALETARGARHVWTTFSEDQVDLDFRNPDVLLEMLELLLLYVEQGAGAIRLDAVAYLWKRIGTPCIHLSETHTLVKLMRDLLNDVAQGTLLITETNVPHGENVSYFGDGDEAQMVYNFSLGPLLLEAFLSGDARPLVRWLSALRCPGRGMTFLNFTASHDGIGLRPLEGLLDRDRFDALVDAVRRRGGLVSTRHEPGGEQPYELNVSYFSALGSPDGLAKEVHVRRFLTSQGVMLALRGVPAVYFHSLVGTPNDYEGVKRTGRNRSINRRKFEIEELRGILADEHGPQRTIFEGYLNMLAVRALQPAFHPDAVQTALDAGHESVIAFTRFAPAANQRILVLANVGERPIRVALDALAVWGPRRELLTGEPVAATSYELGPYALAWLA